MPSPQPPDGEKSLKATSFAFTFIIAGGLLWPVAGCSSPHESGVSPSKRYVDLEPADFEKLCDFAAAQIGGYDSTKECDEPGFVFSARTTSDRAACVLRKEEAVACSVKAGLACEATAEDFEVVWRSNGRCQREPGWQNSIDRFVACRFFSSGADDGPACGASGLGP